MNFIAWKTDNSIAKTAAGIAYILSILAIISGVICIICARHFLKAIKNKLLFYALVFVCVLGIPCIILMQTTVVPREGESPLIYSHTVYFLITTGIGFILNLFAWKTNNKKVKILAGIAYILGLFTVISAILCFVSCKDNRKMPDAGKKSAGGVDV
ncbi:MAG: hypothetical protein LBC76_11055 [Treponema sp.]|nr:hypothetical protein [Treponema sp.]